MCFPLMRTCFLDFMPSSGDGHGGQFAIWHLGLRICQREARIHTARLVDNEAVPRLNGREA
jgi:hypothetical protein